MKTIHYFPLLCIFKLRDELSLLPHYLLVFRCTFNHRYHPFRVIHRGHCVSVAQTLKISQHISSLAPNSSEQRTCFQYTFNYSICPWLNFYSDQICNTLLLLLWLIITWTAVSAWSHHISACEPAAESSSVNLLVLFYVNTKQSSHLHTRRLVTCWGSALFRKWPDTHAHTYTHSKNGWRSTFKLSCSLATLLYKYETVHY